MRIYIDVNDGFRCYVSNGSGALLAYDHKHFDGKCKEYIEGFRCIPEGETWTRSDGVVFQGEMIAPWKPYDELDDAQRAYEKQLLEEYEAALANSVPISELEAAYLEGVNSAYD